MSRVPFAEKPCLLRRPVLIEGSSRSGKLLLGKILAGFERMEYFQSVMALEHIPFIERLGGITRDAAIAMMRTQADERAYASAIGRNLNFRFDDASSIQNSSEFRQYVLRSASPITAETIEEVKGETRLSTFILHECLPNIGIFFEAFPELRWISVVRHPTDLVHSWYRRGWGRRFVDDPLSFVPVALGESGPVPWYAVSWSREYERLSEIDRIIKSMSVIRELSANALGELDDSRCHQVEIIRYEDIVERPTEIIGLVEKFLDRPRHPAMNAILARERCPGNVSLEERRRRHDEIMSLAAPDCQAILGRLVDDYETGRDLTSFRDRR